MTTSSINSADYIPIMTERIVRRFDPLKIILFGSHARGEAGPWSEVDLLVVLPQVPDNRKARVEIRKVLSDLPVAMDIVVATPEEVARNGELTATVLRPALLKGRVLYERT
jgi:predicted nucleotidyltransferase